MVPDALAHPRACWFSEPMNSGGWASRATGNCWQIAQFGCVFAVSACGQVQENPAPPTPTFPTAASNTQIETSLIATRAPGDGTRVVVSYIDSTSESNNGEIVVAPDLNSFTYRVGASRTGWSFTDNDGGSWTRGGKLRPKQPGFVSVSANADLAVDPGNRSVAYMVALGVSLEAWNAVAAFPGPNGEPVQMGDLRQAASDGVCVGRSTNGGGTFADVSCFPMPPATNPRPRGWSLLADAPKVTVDGKGCVWVAVEDIQDVSGPITRLFRTRAPEGTCRNASWSDFVAMAPEAAPGTNPDDVEAMPLRVGERRPILRTDDDGDVWLVTEETATDKVVQLRSFGVSAAAIAGWNFSGLLPVACEGGVGVRAIFQGTTGTPSMKAGTGSSEQIVKALHRLDFDVDRSVPATTRIRYAFTEARTPNDANADDYFLRVGETVRPDGGVGACFTPSGWASEADRGVVVQPLIRRTSRNGDGALPVAPTWWTSGISNGGTFEPDKAQVRLLAFPVGVASFGAPRDLSVLTNYPVCANTLGFWGDYFGLVHYLDSGSTRHVAAIADSRSPTNACARGTSFAAPQHIKSVVW